MERLPYIQIPNTIIQPRVAVGVSLKALALLVGRADLSRELERIALVLKPAEEEAEGKRIANELKGSLPLIYTSETNKSIAYNWKIKINETAKTHAFMNVFPELNHNEIAGFAKNQEGPKAPFKLVLIKDDRDHPRVQKRMEVTAQLLSGGGMKSVETSLKGTTPIERALRSLIVADWAAYHLALVYQVNPDNNPAVEEFKKRMA
jgi:glucose/mannose-6-phosphate isomerase